jgi:hypothetical protein
MKFGMEKFFMRYWFLDHYVTYREQDRVCAELKAELQATSSSQSVQEVNAIYEMVKLFYKVVIYFFCSLAEEQLFVIIEVLNFFCDSIWN